MDVTANAGSANTIRVTGSAPLSSAGALDLKLDGKLDAALANNALSVGGRRVTGAVTAAVQLRGTVAKPQAQGSIRLANGEFRDDQSGFKLSDIAGSIVANGDRDPHRTGRRLDPRRRNDLRRGDLRLDPAAGFPGTIRVTGKHAQLVANGVMSATADMAITVSGRLAQRPNVDGQITIDSMDITVPDRFSSVSAPIPGTKHVNPTPTARARLAEIARANAAGGRTPLFDALLNLTISAPNRNFVRGRGIYAEVGGNLHIAGSARDPAGDRRIRPAARQRSRFSASGSLSPRDKCDSMAT